MLTVPWDGAIRPAIARSRVVLPAPFGPSSAVMPGSTTSETSLTATTPANQRDTASTTIVGCAPLPLIRAPAAGSAAAASAASTIVTPASQSGGHPARERAVALVVEDPVHRVEEDLRQPGQGDRVGDGAGEVLLRDAADRGADEEHGERRDGCVRPPLRDTRR